LGVVADILPLDGAKVFDMGLLFKSLLNFGCKSHMVGFVPFCRLEITFHCNGLGHLVVDVT